MHVPIDPNGNLNTKTDGSDTWTYEWNANNELTRVLKSGAGQARFSYDPSGRRVEKVAGGITTAWVYDGSSILRQLSGASTLRYVHGPVVDEPLASDDGTALSFFHAEGLGSATRTTSAAGAVTLTRQYDAWGNLQTASATPGYAFTGREWDPDTGLYYYRARYYDPNVGRFLSEDPSGLRSGINLYAYVGGNPVTRVDPTGLRMRKCYRQGQGAFVFTNHTYVCDPDTKANYGEDIDTTTLHLSGFTLKAQANAQTSEKDCATGPGVTCVDIPIGPQQERQVFACCKKGGIVPVGPLQTCHEYVDNCLCKAGLCDPPHFPKVRWRDILMTGFRD